MPKDRWRKCVIFTLQKKIDGFQNLNRVMGLGLYIFHLLQDKSYIQLLKSKTSRRIWDLGVKKIVKVFSMLPCDDSE